jgi:gliding motility-associated-like protein
VSHFTLYFSSTKSGIFDVLTTTTSQRDTQYIHIRTDGNAAGCYYVTTTDSVGNESKSSNIVCIDNCPAYTLPNAFTPNDDKQNDIFKATTIKFISSINIKIFNRWGDVVFESTDPKFNWDGKNKSGTDVAEGTYFYTCTVIENRVNGPTPNATPLSGYIELRRR